MAVVGRLVFWLVGLVDRVWTRLWVLHDVVFPAGELWKFVKADRSLFVFPELGSTR